MFAQFKGDAHPPNLLRNIGIGVFVEQYIQKYGAMAGYLSCDDFPFSSFQSNKIPTQRNLV
jgi:hypothetical protein